ncbi:MAG: DUF1566 domain-containing protein [bacterium]|nr:DUF1566 domain-containing protein [bacterium]
MKTVAEVKVGLLVIILLVVGLSGCSGNGNGGSGNFSPSSSFGPEQANMETAKLGDVCRVRRYARNCSSDRRKLLVCDSANGGGYAWILDNDCEDDEICIGDVQRDGEVAYAYCIDKADLCDPNGGSCQATIVYGNCPNEKQTNCPFHQLGVDVGIIDECCRTETTHECIPSSRFAGVYEWQRVGIFVTTEPPGCGFHGGGDPRRDADSGIADTSGYYPRDGSGSDASVSEDVGGAGETWYDPTSNLTWQVNPSPSGMPWQYAINFCQGLGDGWHLPTISELRSLIRGCVDTQTNGSCEVNENSCPTTSCTYYCMGCERDQGPAGGQYCPSELLKDGEVVSTEFWSSSTVADDLSEAWLVSFLNGRVIGFYITADHIAVRCVHSGQ